MDTLACSGVVCRLTRSRRGPKPVEGTYRATRFMTGTPAEFRVGLSGGPDHQAVRRFNAPIRIREHRIGDLPRGSLPGSSSSCLPELSGRSSGAGGAGLGADWCASAGAK